MFDVKYYKSTDRAYNEYVLDITHNGLSWTQSLIPLEHAQKVIDALQAELDKQREKPSLA